MPNALIVAHGQPSDPEPAEAALADYAAEVNDLCEGVSVGSATLAAPGRLEACLKDMPDGSLIYPLFMAKGWFVTSALPKRLGGAALRILDPLGVEENLPRLVSGALEAELSESKWHPDETTLVLAAHGSGRSRNPSAVATEFADNLQQQIAFNSIRVGFVEEPPSIAEAATGVGKKALCLPFFACTGGHVLDDVPSELAEANFEGRVLPVVGELPGIKRHIASVLQQAFDTVG